MINDYKCECGETLLPVGDYCRECPVCGASDGPCDNPNKPVDNPYLRRESPPMGHWTKEPPAKPGWYWIVPIVEYAGMKMDFVTMAWTEPDTDEYYTLRNEKAHTLNSVKYWWSEPLKAPPLPKEE